MALHLLGISRSRDLPRVAEQSTVGQIAVRWVFVDELACAVIDASRGSLDPLQHAAALEAIHRRICVLPMRFAAAPSAETEIRSMLETRRQNLLEQLDQIEGSCEMGLRIALPKRSAVEGLRSHRASLPSSYLQERRAYYQCQDSLGEQARLTVEHLVQELSGTYRDWRTLDPSPPGLVRLAFLVERERAGWFQGSLEASGTERPEEKWTVLGPWPPYSFV